MDRVQLKAVFFDLDGTLVQSDLDFDLIRRQIGVEEGSILEWLERQPADTRARGEAILERHEREAAERSVLTVGAERVLQMARKRGLRVGVITRNSRESLNKVFGRLGLTADLALCREDGPPKPSPWPVLEACRRLGVEPSESLVVGDFRYDIQSGVSAGAWTAYLRRGKDDPDVHLAHWVLEGLEDLLPLLTERSRRR